MGGYPIGGHPMGGCLMGGCLMGGREEGVDVICDLYLLEALVMLSPIGLDCRLEITRSLMGRQTGKKKRGWLR
jgi:hypothetical protein